MDVALHRAQQDTPAGLRDVAALEGGAQQLDDLAEDLARHDRKGVLAGLVPMAIQMGVGAANGSGTPFALLPLHKGADGFMSNADFKTAKELGIYR